MKLSAVIACYRDAPAVPIMHERLVRVFTQLEADYEIIFVNDGSPDNARQVLAELAACDPHVVVINHARAFGSQSAFTSGMQIATGDAVVLLDGDLQDPPELISEFVARWRDGYDVVYGERVRRETSRFMQVAYRVVLQDVQAASLRRHTARRRATSACLTDASWTRSTRYPRSTGSSVAYGRGSASSNSGSPTSGRIGCSAVRPTRCVRTSAGRVGRSSRFPTLHLI